MTHELILKREDGSKVKIIARFYVESFRNEFKYDIEVHACEKNKRTWIGVVNTNDYDYRRQEFPHGRDKWAMNKMLEFVTAEEILQAKIELWNKLKPTL